MDSANYRKCISNFLSSWLAVKQWLFLTFQSLCLLKSWYTGGGLQWRTKELETVWKKSPSRNCYVGLCSSWQFFDGLWVHRFVPLLPPPPYPAMLWPKKALIFTHFAQNSTLFGVRGEGSLVLLIYLERSQHFWPPLQNKDFGAVLQTDLTNRS